MMTPTTALRLSPLHDELAHHRHPIWSEIAAMPVVHSYGDAAGEVVRAGSLGLCDVSALARMTLKGPGAGQFLAANQVAAPEQIPHVGPIDRGGLVARTGGAEYFVEDGFQGTTVERLRAALGFGRDGCYPVLRQDASMLLSGRRAGEVFLQSCGYDFRAPGSTLVMTRVAGVSCSILHRTLNDIGTFQLWLDGTYGAYLWETLLGIVHELGGEAIGAAAFFPDLAPVSR